MRDLMECQAEVFRRSEKRIKAGKRRRKHMLAACIPLVLCLGLVLLADGGRAGENGSALPESAADGAILEVADPGSPEFSQVETATPSQSGNGTVSGVGFAGIAQIHVKGMEEPITDGETLVKIASILHGEYRGQQDVQETDDGENLKTETMHSQTENRTYRLEVKLRDGTVREYTLTGNVLEAPATGESRNLETSEVLELYALLGIGDKEVWE